MMKISGLVLTFKLTLEAKIWAFPQSHKMACQDLEKLKRKIKSQFGFVSKSLIDPAPQYRKQKFQQFLKKKMPNYL